MGYRIKIKDTTYDLKDGFTIKEEFNETLDSATVQFATYGEELDKEPFDSVSIFHSEDDIETKHFDVDSIVDDIYCFGDSLENSDHLYTMNLFSETKELERITLPSCSVTQPIGENVTKTTVWQEISRLCAQYLPEIKIAVEQEGGVYSIVYYPIFTIDSAVRTKFLNVECPEFQWDNPTLREVLNDLMSTLDCIVVVKDHIITYYDLTYKGNAIDATKLTRMTSSFSSNDYISELTMYMKNGVGKNATKSYRYQTCRTTDESGEITTDNMAIITQKPIYSIKSLKIYFIASSKRLHCVDVASRVIEYDNFKTKSRIYVGLTIGSAYYNLPTWTDAVGCTMPEHQVNYLYYKRGGFSIENIGKTFSGSQSGLCFLTQGYLNMCYTLRYMDNQTVQDLGDSLKNSARNIFYEIEYETLYEQAMHFGKNIPNNHPENRIFDNQSNAYVDIQNQSIFEYAKVNRLSNQIKEIYGEYETESEVPVLGDYIDDYILFSKETTYYDNKIMFKGYLTKNYILKDYYTGIMSKKRSWQIASQQEALTKHEIIKNYVEASFEKKTDNLSFYQGINNTGHGQGLIYDLTYVKNISSDVVQSKVLNKVRIQTSISGSNFPESGKALALDSDVEILGNSICWTFGFEDNYKGSDYAILDGTLYTQNFYPYANDYGNFSSVIIDIVYDIPDELVDSDSNAYTLPLSWEENGDDEISYADRDALNEQFRSKPICTRQTLGSTNGVYGFSIRKINYKDAREIFKATVQFEYCSDTPDISVKPKFLEYVRAVNASLTKNSDLKVYISTTETYSVNDTIVKGIPYNLSYLSYSTYNNGQSILISQTASPLSSVKSWAIATADGELLLSVNGNKAIYFNLLTSRDTNVYYSVLDRTVVGNIKEGGMANLTVNLENHESDIEENAHNEHSSTLLIGGGSGHGRTIDKNDTITPVEFMP